MVERLRVELILVIIFGALLVIVKCENCAQAPTCPDISTWKPGFICEINFIPIIKTRLIDGLKKKTICCRAINSKCKKQFWCKPQNSNIEVLMENSSLPTRTSCSSGCSPIWKEFDVSSNNIFRDGVRAGSFSPGISSFIGRTLVNGELQIGRIQISHPTGLYYTFDGSVHFTNSSIEYLEDSNFIWKNSSHGALVRNAVTLTAVKNLPFYIGRIQVNGFSYIGTVVRVLGLMYYSDENGIEKTTDCYEVLTCLVGGVSEEMTGIVESPEDMASGSAGNIIGVDFEATTSSVASIIELSTQSVQNSSNLNQQSTLPSTDHSGPHTNSLGSFPTISSTDSSTSAQNSSKIPVTVDETINEDTHNSSGYSYNPPLIALSLSTSTEQSQDNLSTTESSTSQATTSESSNSLIEVFTAYKPSNTATSSQSNSASSSHLSHNAQSSTIDSITMHSWTQLPPLALNESTLLQSMSQMSSISSSTEKVSATITTENNNEVHNVNVGEQIALQQLTSSAVGMGNGDGLDGNWGGNSWSNASGIGGDLGMNVNEKPDDGNSSASGSENGEILSQIDGNLGQLVVENEGGIEVLGSDLNYNQATSTEKAEYEVSQAIYQSTENAEIATISHNFQPSGGQGHLGIEITSQNSSLQSLSNTKPSISQTTRTKPTRTTTKASNHYFPSTDINSAIDVASSAFIATDASDLPSTSDIPTASTEPNESENSNLLYSVSTDPNQFITSNYHETSTNEVDFNNQTSNFNTQVTKKSTRPQEYATTAAEFTKDSSEYPMSITSTTETSNPNLMLTNSSLTSSALPITSSSSRNPQEFELSLTVVTSEKPIDSTSTSTADPVYDSTTDSTLLSTISNFTKDSTTIPEDSPQTTSRFTSFRPTFSTSTRRSTTSRTTRTRFTRSTTTKRIPTVEQQSGEDLKPGWLFTTAGTTESVITEQLSGSQEDLGTTSSTEVTEENNGKEMFECVPHWKQLSAKSSFLYDGIEITSQNTNFLSYIGQISINNSQILGRIDLKPQNPPTFSFYFNNSNQVSTTDTITYLSIAQLQNYSWKVSSKGLAVKNAISINQTENWPYYIGRIKSNGVILIGKVLPSIGLVYADKYGNENISKAYEVLTCETVVDEGGGCGIRS